MLEQYVPGFAGYIPQFVPTSANPVAQTTSSTTSGSVASATGGSSTSTLVPATAALRRNALTAAERTFTILQTGLPAHSDLEIYQVAQNKITYNKNGCASSPTLPVAPTDLTCIALGLNAAHEVIHRYVLEAQDLLVNTTNVGQDAQVRAKCKRQLLALNKFSESIVSYYENLYKFYYYICGIYPCLVHAPLRNDLLSIDTIIQWIKRTAYKLSAEANDNTMYLAAYVYPSSSTHAHQQTRQTFLWPDERSLLNEVLAMNLVVSYLGANQGAHWPKLLLDRIKVDVPQQFHGLKSANDTFLKIFTADGYIKRQAPQDPAPAPKRKRGARGRGGGSGGGGGRGRSGRGGGGRGGGRSASETQSSTASSTVSSAGSSN